MSAVRNRFGVAGDRDGDIGDGAARRDGAAAHGARRNGPGKGDAGARAGFSRVVRGGSRPANWIAGGLACAIVVTVAIVANGFDARETPREEPSVWSMRSTGQYARVNTETGEIDTVRTVEEPSDLVQSGADGIVFSHGNGRAWGIDPMSPADLVEEAPADDTGDAGADGEVDAEGDDAETAGAGSGGAQAVGGQGPAEGPMRTPEGTRDTVSAGDAVVFRTDTGEVHLSILGHGESGARLSTPQLLDPLAESEGTDGDADADESAEEDEADDGADDGEDSAGGYRADAVALTEDGLVAMFSAAESAVRWYDSERSEFVGGVDLVPDDVPVEAVQMSVVDGDWVLFDAESATLWRGGADEGVPVPSDAAALLQSAGGEGDGSDVLIADGGGLWSVPASDEAERVVDVEGAPARPTVVGGVRHAAWLGAQGGTLWSSEDPSQAGSESDDGGSGADGETVPLEIDEAAGEEGEPELVFRSNGTRALVTDVRTGMMWTVPDGELIPVEQWSLVDPPKDEEGTVVVEDVQEQEPPVAVDDEFGVRPDEPAQLPVLLNDYDPNKRDVLTVVPDGLGEGLPEEFGRVDMLSDGQGLMFTPSDSAEGTASFSYRITDGTHVSEPATVTLTAVTDDSNTAPEWCPVKGCQRAWPSPELAPGGTLVLPILEGWVDPEGDPMTLMSAEPTGADDPVRALVTADGQVAVRHADPNAGEGEVGVNITVADARGAEQTRELLIRVRPGALMDFPPLASTVKTGEEATLRPLTRVSGGSGAFELVDAVAQDDEIDVSVNQGAGTVKVMADEPGSTVLTVTVRDAGTDAETTGTLRVTAVESRGDLALPPLRAFVRPLADTTVEVLDAVPGAADRALAVRDAQVLDGEMSVDVIEHARIRVSGGTVDGAPGRIGSANVVVSEGSDTAEGRLTVFQVPDGSATGGIAVPDTATVRAGSIVDIPVLDNDVAPPGERLVLHPEIGAPGERGELAFASGNQLRYLAPNKPGTYTLTYTAYGASSPEASDVGHVQVTVLPRDGNRNPQPPPVTLRLAPGETSTTQVPLSGVDPDGDRVRLTGVEAPDDPLVGATLAPRSSAVQVEAARSTTPGVYFGSYTVRDEFGGEGEGRVRVIVTEAADAAGAPVVYSDYVRLTKGVSEPATVRPLDNDLDPARGDLELVDVVPNVPEGSAAEHDRLEERLDTSQLKRGIVRVSGGDDLGTFSYRYTVRSKASKSTSDGLIVVQVSERVGQQAPTVRDTVLSVRDRAELASGGVDVVTDRVYWPTGDASSLKLSLWGGAADRYSVSGKKIVGQYRAEGDLVPFKLSGRDAMGEEVETFGFLVVPPLDELRLTLKPGMRPISVDENESETADLADIVDLGPGDRAEFREGRFPVQRGQASCEATGATQIRYTAGRGDPWSDSCVVSVKLQEQKAWTQLAVPVRVVPDEPVAELSSMTRTVAPGQAETIDLTEMVSWQGGHQGDAGSLRFQVSGGGEHFEVAQSGSSVRVEARADAPSGNQETVNVSVSGAGRSEAPLALRVGVAPRDAPRGATVALDCTVGSSCQTNVIGAPGEYDPFAGKSGGGLELVSVDGRGCQIGGFRVSGEAVVVDWDDNRAPGGQCTASYTVKDAQGRVGTGTVELDAQGVPRPPASISAQSYTGSSVTLEVVPNSRPAHPGVSGVVIYQDGRRAEAGCSAAGGAYRCTVGGLEPGEKHSFTARAVNAVGESAPSSAVTAWAYETPRAPRVSAEQVSAESASSGTVRLSISGERGTAGYRVVTPNGETRENGRNATVTVSGVPTGRASYSVIPLSGYEAPPGESPEGAAADGSITVTGRPAVEVKLSSAPGSDRVTAEVRMTSGANAGAPRVSAGLGNSCGEWRNGTSQTFRFDGERHKNLTVTACAENKWGSAARASDTVKVGGEPQSPQIEQGYRIEPNATEAANRINYRLTQDPRVRATTPGATVQHRVGGGSPTGSFQPPAVAGQRAEVRQCTDTGDAGTCSGWMELPRDGGFPAEGEVALSGVCVPESDPESALTISDSIRRLGKNVTADGGTVTIEWHDGLGTIRLTGGQPCAAGEG